MDLINNIVKEGCISDDWRKSILVPVYKEKGDPLVCGSYRAIKLLEQPMKVDEWLICTVMAFYTEDCTVVRTDAGLSEHFDVQVGLHQGLVLGPLLFAAVMYVVSSEARSGLPSELLYADDLVIMAPTMEQLGRRG